MYKVLIVEDEELMRRGLSLFTRWENFDLVLIGEARNGAEGYEMAVRLRPDLILTDIRMPAMSGIDMIKEIHKVYSPMFIILSAYTDFEYAKKAIKLKAVDYLVKPFSDEELKDTLINAVQMIIDQNDRTFVAEKINKLSSSAIAMFDSYLLEHTTSKNASFNKVVTIIKNQFDQDISLKSLSRQLSLSESYLSKLFKKESGYTFHDYLTQYRIKKACDYLLETDLKVYEIVDKIGLKDQRYFSVVFRKYVGLTPTQFRDKQGF